MEWLDRITNRNQLLEMNNRISHPFPRPRQSFSSSANSPHNKTGARTSHTPSLHPACLRSLDKRDSFHQIIRISGDNRTRRKKDRPGTVGRRQINQIFCPQTFRRNRIKTLLIEDAMAVFLHGPIRLVAEF